VVCFIFHFVLDRELEASIEITLFLSCADYLPEGMENEKKR